MPTLVDTQCGRSRRSHGRGVRLIAGHTIRVGGGLRLAGGRRGDHRRAMRATIRPRGAELASCNPSPLGDATLVCMVDGNLPDRPRCTMFAHPCGDIPQERRQEGHRVAPSPGGVRGPSLWPSTSQAFLLVLRPGVRNAVGRWRSLVRSVVGVRPPRALAVGHRLPRPGSRSSGAKWSPTVP